jgi:hypothetical protein
VPDVERFLSARLTTASIREFERVHDSLKARLLAQRIEQRVDS